MGRAKSRLREVVALHEKVRRNVALVRLLASAAQAAKEVTRVSRMVGASRSATPRPCSNCNYGWYRSGSGALSNRSSRPSSMSHRRKCYRRRARRPNGLNFYGLGCFCGSRG